MNDITAMLEQSIIDMRAEGARRQADHEALLADMRRRTAKLELQNDELHAARLARLGAPPSRALQMPPAPEPAPPSLAEEAAIALVRAVDRQVQAVERQTGTLVELERFKAERAGRRRIKGTFNDKPIDLEIG